MGNFLDGQVLHGDDLNNIVASIPNIDNVCTIYIEASIQDESFSIDSIGEYKINGTYIQKQISGSDLFAEIHECISNYRPCYVYLHDNESDVTYQLQITAKTDFIYLTALDYTVTSTNTNNYKLLRITCTEQDYTFNMQTILTNISI